MSGQKRKLFIDCTYTKNKKINTGVSRVVQNIVQNSSHIAEHYDLELITIKIQNDLFYKKDINECNGLHSDKPKKTLFQKFLYIFNRPFKKVKPIVENDILLLIEHRNGIKHMNAIKRFKNNGGRVIYVIHDLIPIRYPKFCEKTIEDFTFWFHETLKYADAYIAVSKTVMKDVQLYLSDNYLKIDHYLFDYFRLGSNYKKQVIESIFVRHDITSVFESTSSVYLIVSTIEPRKNHSYLLHTFEKLWNRDSDAILLIVGKIGWKIEELIEQIKTHAQYGKKLIMFNDLGDNELAYCYEHARTLLFPSYTEGFGLPIVESLQAGLPVLASDTPIHREVGKNDIKYFDIFDQLSLVKLIESIEKGEIILKNIKQNPVKITSWKESTAELLSKIIKI